MFKLLSKVGQREENTKRIFAERAAILSGDLQAKTVQNKKKKRQVRNILSDFDKGGKVEREERSPKPSCMFSSVSRDKLTGRDEKFPPVGCYNINYQSILKSVSVPKIIMPKAKPTVPRMDQFICQKNRTIDPDKNDRPIKGMINFDKQLPRVSKCSDRSHESGFNLNFEAFRKNVSSPNFKKQIPRHEMFKSNFGLEYAPNKEKFMEKISVDFDFDKMIGRNSQSKFNKKRSESVFDSKTEFIQEYVPAFLNLPVSKLNKLIK